METETYNIEDLTLYYKVMATDEFGRYFEATAKIAAQHLLFKEQADSVNLQMMVALLTHILLQMGSAAYAEWSVEVQEEFADN